ncbi:MAG: dihydroxy-acid dehydratase [Xanthomonadales bacterium]|jgi:dihydroxy-acid dehydratase|nr:dihydroxy-acid dehydratase [Xanthomonadales bacterium]
MSYKKKDAGLPDFARVEREEMLRGAGLGREAIRRPQIGVVSSWGEVNPGSVHLDKITGFVKNGIWAAGGTPREFVISSICTSMAGHDNYHLPHRDLVAGYIETVAMTNLFDAMVYVPVCDDVVPGHLMALARIDIPSIVVTGGYMSLNRFKGKPIDPLTVANKHYNDFKEGRTTKQEFSQIKDRGCKGTGACPVMGTANTMAVLTEALGLSLPGTAATPGADSRLQRVAFAAGQRVMDLLMDDIRPSQILTEQAFSNAIRMLMATGGSTNGVLHLQSIAAELDIDLTPEMFNRASRSTPFICGIAPNGPGMMQDLDEAGGVPAVMKELENILDTDVMTVTGQSLAETLKVAPRGDGKIIRSIDDPIASEGGLMFLEGSLAPEGALIKNAAVPKSMYQFKGPACLFDTEDDASNALMTDQIAPGSVVIVRGIGPAGDPGMRLLQRFLWMSAAKGMMDKIAFLTDGRFSGTNKGCAVAHISPEAAVGGPLALVENGDLIEIDIPNARLDLHVSAEEMARREALWSPPDQKVKKGYLSIYSRMADSTARGASLKYR